MKQILNNLKERLRSLGTRAVPDPREATLREASIEKDATASAKRSELDPASSTAASGKKPDAKGTLEQTQQPQPSQSRTKKAVLSKPRQNPLHAPSGGGLWGASAANSAPPPADPLGLSQGPMEGAASALTGSILEPSSSPAGGTAEHHPRAAPARQSPFGAETTPQSRYSFFGGAGGAAEQPQPLGGGSGLLDPAPSLFGPSDRTENSGRGPF